MLWMTLIVVGMTVIAASPMLVAERLRRQPPRLRTIRAKRVTTP